MSVVDGDVDVGDVDVGDLVDIGRFRWLEGAARDEAFVAVERRIRRLQALQAEMAAEVHASGSYTDDGHRNSVSWVKNVLNCRFHSAKTIVEVAVARMTVPTVAGLHDRGDVGGDQMRIIAEVRRNPRVRAALATPEADEMLAEMAPALTIEDFKTACRRFVDHVDPDGTCADHQRAVHDRRVRIVRSGARHEIHIYGDVVSGEIIENILGAHAEAEYERDVAEHKAQHPDDGLMWRPPRTPEQRHYDAFMEICCKAGASNDTAGSRVPLVNLITTPERLEQIIRDHTATTTAITWPADGPGDRGYGRAATTTVCETVNGTRVDPSDLLAAALIGHIRRVVVDSASRVIDLGRRSRLFTGAAREAVLLAGSCCNRCGIAIANLQIDHLQPWARAGGETNPLNAGGMCAHCNRAKHRLRITVTRDHTGWHHWRPDGTEIAPRGRNATEDEPDDRPEPCD